MATRPCREGVIPHTESSQQDGRTSANQKEGSRATVISTANRVQGFNSLGALQERASHNFLFRKDLKRFVLEYLIQNPGTVPAVGID